MQSSGSPQLDLTGKLIIKVALGDDIRRIPIHNEDITYDELVLMMQRVYRGKLSTNDDITIKYKDEDNDLITIFDSSDLTFAIQCSRILKITLFVNCAKTSIEPADTVTIRNELQDIRDKVIGLLDRLEHSRLIGAAQSFNITDAIVEKNDASRFGTVPPADGPKHTNLTGGKEFDPLKSQISADESTQNKVMSSFGVENNAPTAPSQTPYDRAATPDSVSSIGSSSSNQIRAQQASQQNPGVPSQPQQPGIPQQPPQQPSQQQQQTPFAPGQSGLMSNNQNYGGQPSYSQPGPMPGQPNQFPHQQQQPQPNQLSNQQPQGAQPSSQPYDSSMYANAYNQNPGFQTAPGQPGQAQGQAMYGQPGSAPPNPYGQAPGMPQTQQPKAPGYPQGQPPGQSPGNPYSRGNPSYGGGYPRPSAGYPQ